jgi:predicted transglutaminase-like cysteine proteinase
MKLRAITVLGALCALVPPAAAAEGARPVKVKAAVHPYMRVYGQTSPPIGYVQFCERMPFECDGDGHPDARIDLSPQRLAEVDRLNRAVNREIKPATDLELYGLDEYWTYPDERKKGDCEDYVLLKRKMLVQRGWPQSALLITVVRDERQEGHAVLLMRTVQGDFILDNKTDDIRPWHRTPYEYVMRQSYIDPRIWMSLEPSEADRMTVAGVRRTR